MDQRTYWLCLFNATTWQEFLAAGGDTVGFPHTQHKTVFSIQPGDYIFAYMTKISKWVATLEVVSDAYFDTDTPIWKQATFPCRVKVKFISLLEPEQGVPVLSLAPQLTLFDNLKSPTHWGLLFRTAPRRLAAEDGLAIAQAIQAKLAAAH